MTHRTVLVLVIEDGYEYTEAFQRLGSGGGAEPKLRRAGDAEQAREVLAAEAVDAVFVDMVFDRIPPERLAGDLGELVLRFGGDRRRAEDHLARNQGFYILDALAPLLAPAKRLILAWDFGAEPDRLEALRERFPNLSDLPEGTPITTVFQSLLG